MSGRLAAGSVATSGIPVAAAGAGGAGRKRGGGAGLWEWVGRPGRGGPGVARPRGGFGRGGPGAPADRRYRIDQVQQLRDVGPIGGGQRRDERNPVGVGKNMMLRPGFTAISRVRSSFFPPRIARNDALSTTARARSSRPRRRNSARSTAWSRF